jgi:pimeloyl-ACP methyl ester carboxylesterase
VQVEGNGKGSPLLLIHGAGNYSGRWNPIFPLFEKDFSIFALDRRGRGESGDASEYSLERELKTRLVWSMRLEDRSMCWAIPWAVSARSKLPYVQRTFRG